MPTSTAADLFYAIASTSVGLVNGSIYFWINLGGVLIGLFAAFAITYAVIAAGKTATR